MIQLRLPAAVGILDSHRRWVVLCAGLQALCFVPLVVSALAHEMDLLLYAVASVYWGFGCRPARLTTWRARWFRSGCARPSRTGHGLRSWPLVLPSSSAA
ncbi:MAG: hypothetical protein IPK00_24770 [Deltaproteobacteria bacterium]|nr:hypothetical protein [Deltaproteobacteria bacterium]